VRVRPCDQQNNCAFLPFSLDIGQDPYPRLISSDDSGGVSSTTACALLTVARRRHRGSIMLLSLAEDMASNNQDYTSVHIRM